MRKRKESKNNPQIQKHLLYITVQYSSILQYPTVIYITTSRARRVILFHCNSASENRWNFHVGPYFLAVVLYPSQCQVGKGLGGLGVHPEAVSGSAVTTGPRPIDVAQDVAPVLHEAHLHRMSDEHNEMAKRITGGTSDCTFEFAKVRSLGGIDVDMHICL